MTIGAPPYNVSSSCGSEEGVSVVPSSHAHRLSARQQALFLTTKKFSGVKWSALRKALGDQASGLASREVMRGELRAFAQEPGRQVRTDARRAHLVGLRDAIECLFAELVTAGLFREGLVRGSNGEATPHTAVYYPIPGVPYQLHADSVADVHLCLGLDKGGRGMSTAKLVMTTPNQVHPMSRSNSILKSTLPCTTDDNADLHAMIGPWMADIRDLLQAGVTVNYSLRAVRLFLNGDLDFVSNVLGHKEASARLPGVSCLVVGRPCKANEALVAAYGSMQEVAVNPTSLRTGSRLQAMMEA
ncbi:hypothetical protein I4F81_009240 [Pyropia yezoensis]|uniref:Uncharacterized protein n=1 Tax=Pyropia yezoensis TaxID=2788 RepID=A0ACC3C9D3_PYRYE|nr:hypothetical protein I4F81_009240 [Neopyropia yezoensis]